jgi:hypothetical protein
LKEVSGVQITRVVVAEYLDSPMLKELVAGALIRFSIQNGKYILGFVDDVSQGTQKYDVQFQKNAGVDKASGKRVVKNEIIQTQKEFIAKMGNFGIYEKPRKVRISHISNSAPTAAEFT